MRGAIGAAVVHCNQFPATVRGYQATACLQHACQCRLAIEAGKDDCQHWWDVQGFTYRLASPSSGSESGAASCGFPTRDFCSLFPAINTRGLGRGLVASVVRLMPPATAGLQRLVNAPQARA